MKASYMCDSMGNVHNTYAREIVHIMPLQERIGQMQSLASSLIACFPDMNDECFDYIVQPQYVNEKLLFFSKTFLPASSQAVKLSNAIKKDTNYICTSREQEDILKSIYSSEETGRTCWWFLSAEILFITRNLYDKNIINIRKASVPHYRFIADLTESLKSDEADMNGFSRCYSVFSTGGRNYRNTNMLLRTAVIRDDSFEDRLTQLLSDYMEELNLDQRDRDSNRKTLCLQQIVDCRAKNVYPYWNELKWYMRKTEPQTLGIHYKRNVIVLGVSEYSTAKIYVSGCEEPMFLAGGYSYADVDALKSAINSRALWKRTKWFTEIEPYIQ